MFFANPGGPEGALQISGVEDVQSKLAGGQGTTYLIKEQYRLHDTGIKYDKVACDDRVLQKWDISVSTKQHGLRFFK